MRIGIAVVVGLAIAGALALSPALAQEWCGFHQKAGARVQCGFSSMHECEQVLTGEHRDKKGTDKMITCLPDPASG